MEKIRNFTYSHASNEVEIIHFEATYIRAAIAEIEQYQTQAQAIPTHQKHSQFHFKQHNFIEEFANKRKKRKKTEIRHQSKLQD